MPNKEIARRIVTGYINSIPMDFNEKVMEVSAVNHSDEALLEHINLMIDVLEKDRKEILDEKKDKQSNVGTNS